MIETKDTNPKDAIGIRKTPISTLPVRVLWRVGLAMLEGALKYGRHNYRGCGVRASVYFDAVVARHLFPWWEGEDMDVDSQLSHIDKAIAGLMVMRDSMLEGNFVDDRPPSCAFDMAELNKHAAMLFDRAEGRPAPHHWTIADKATGTSPIIDSSFQLSAEDTHNIETFGLSKIPFVEGWRRDDALMGF